MSQFELFIFGVVVTALGGVYGFIMRQMFNRLSHHETETADKFERARDRHDAAIQKVYQDHETKTSALYQKTDELRTDINKLSESIREQMAANAKETNALIMQVLDRRGQ